jgi:hypothetical protein
MKSRQGFVSNSSSSSFVIVGCHFSDVPGGMNEERANELGLSVPGYGEIDVVGQEIANWEYESLCSTNLQEVNRIALEVAATLKVNPDRIHILSGTYGS